MENIMLADLSPRHRVPDTLAEYLQNEPQTVEEAAAGLVLAVHRRWLNGGFETTMSNLDIIGLSMASCSEAYLTLALPEPAKVLAALAAKSADLSGAEWEMLDVRYERLTYGDPETADAIEAAVIVFAQSHSSTFKESESALRS